ncbi:MAG: hypothetical protein V1921_01420 [Candidatus Altiarchaeota archaeon]
MGLYGSMLRSAVLPLTPLIGTNFWAEYMKLERSQHMSREKLEELQWKKLKSLIDYSYRNVEYYRRLFDDGRIKPSDIRKRGDMSKIPISTKESLSKSVDRATSRMCSKKDLISNSTSGSTGTPFKFFMDRQLLDMERANLYRGYEWAGLLFGDPLIKIWGPHNITFKTKLFDAIMRRELLSAFNMDDTTMREYAERIRRKRPALLECYVSAAYGLSKFMLDNSIKPPEVGAIITSGETLPESQRKTIEEAFNAKVYNRYGSREFGMIAQECEKQDGLHVNMESFYIETVSFESGEPVREGERGRMIVTSLENHGMPFIRYDIGDVGILSTVECGCGRGLEAFSEVSGRMIDLIKTPRGKIVSVHFMTLLFEDYADYIRNFQVVEKGSGMLQVLLEPMEKMDERVTGKLRQAMEDYLGEGMTVEFKNVDRIPLTKSGKRAILRREY